MQLDTSFIGVLYIKVFYGVFNKFRSIKIPDYLKPAIGGLLLGFVILFVPRVMGMGYATIQDAINYKIALDLLLVLVFAKIIATSLSIGSGGAGGVIAPSLFIGAALGGAVGRVAMIFFPQASVHPALFVIAGMGALYASVGKVPLSTAIILSETTRNFTMIFPLVISNTVAYLASGKHTIYEGQHANMIQDKKKILETIKVGEVMQTDFIPLSPETTINGLLNKVRESEHHGYPVLENKKLVGVVSWHDTREVPLNERDTVLVKDVMTKEVISLTANKKVRDALNLMDEYKIGRVIVVSSDNSEDIRGIVTRNDVIKAYLKVISN